MYGCCMAVVAWRCYDTQDYQFRIRASGRSVDRLEMHKLEREGPSSAVLHSLIYLLGTQDSAINQTLLKPTEVHESKTWKWRGNNDMEEA